MTYSRMKRWLALLVISLGSLVFCNAALTITGLNCEHRMDPLGVDVLQPRLGWILESTQRNERQTAYQVLVATSRDLLEKHQGDLWDSGKVASDETIQISFSGRPLKSSQQVFWKVRVWDAQGRGSAWSSPGTWTMGLLEQTDWLAKWIESPNTNKASPWFRHEFIVKPNLRRAVVHICGLGHYELSANGKKVGDNLLAPGWSLYNRTCLYDTFELTASLHPGANAVGLVLGHGMYDIQPDRRRYVKFLNSFGPLKAIVQLQLEYADGTREVIGSDSNWKTAASPITFDHVFAGEDFDARGEQSGWDKPGFATDPRWAAARETSGPGGALRGLSAAAPPIRAIEVLPPIGKNSLATNVTVYDLGQNAPIMPRLSVSGPPGSRVRLIPAELLKPDGTVDRASCTQDGVRPAWWQYTLRGAGTETWFPKFFYQGCRYLQVEVQPGDNGELPKVEKLEGVVVHSSATPIGEFTSSSDLFNRIYQLVRWAQRANMMSLMTDCPHREKLGWLEETHLNGPSLRYNFEMAPLLQKTMNDMADSQLANGFVPNIAPEYFIASKTNLTDPFRNSPEWGGAFVMVAWQQYQFAGDIALLRRHYEDMKRYVAFLGGTANRHIVSTGLGDWYDLGPKEPWGSQLTPPALTATAFYQHYNWILARVAELLGKPEEARHFDELATQIRAAFNQAFFNPVTRQYANGSQCANSLAIVMNLVETTNRAAVLDAIVADVRKRGNALTTGDVGYRYLLRALAENGRSDVIFDINNQSEKPGYGYQLRMGATSLTEKWNAGVGNFGSQNHFMLGQINEWFFHDLAGIASDPAGPGFRKIVIHPAIVGDLTQVHARYQSVRGPIVSDWKREGDQFSLRASIPPNTTAQVFIPARAANSVKVDGRDVARASGITWRGMESGNAILEVGSGEYQFSSTLPLSTFSSTR